MSIRTAKQIAESIVSFKPTSGNWRALDELVEELWATGEPQHAITEMFSVFERFPEEDGAGVFWSILHGLESLEGYESELLLSLRRVPTEFGTVMLGRLLNANVSDICGTKIDELLESIASNSKVPGDIRATASSFLKRHTEGMK